MFSAFCRLAGIGVACVLASPASAQLVAHKDLSTIMALTIAQTAIETCAKQGYRVSVTVVGRSGHILVQVRGDNASPHTLENSTRKAYTARTTRAPSGNLDNRVKDNPQLSLHPPEQHYRE